MLMEQIQQLQKTVMQLQANSVGGGGGVLGSGPIGGGGGDYGGYGGGPAFGRGNAGYGMGGGGGGYGANAGFGGGYAAQGSGGYGGGQQQRGSSGPRQPRRENKEGDEEQGGEIKSDDQRVLLVSNIPMNLSFPDSIFFAFEKAGLRR